MESLNHATLRLWLSQTRAFWLRIGIIFISTVVANISILGVPIGYKHLTDGFIQNDYHNIVTAVYIIVGFNLIAWVFFRIAEIIAAYVGPKVQATLLRLCFATIHEQPQHFFEDHLSGSIARRVNLYADGFISLYEQVLWNSSATLVSLFGAAIILGLRHWTFAVALISWGVIYAIIVWRVTVYNQQFNLARAKYDSAASGHLNDTLSNQLAVHTSNTIAREQSTYKKITDKMAKSKTQAWLVDSLFDGTQGFLMIVVEAVLLVLAITGFKRNIIQVSDIVMIQAYVIVIIQQYWFLGRFFRKQYEAFADAKGMTEIFRSQEQAVKQVANSRYIPKGKIVLNKVTFGYNEQQSVIKNLSLTVEPGERVALVGPSGGGKSTIFKLLLNLYQPTTGTVQVRSNQIAFVPQDPQLFHRTIKDNIRYARPKATQAEIEAAAKAAQAHDFIKNFPKGYQTLVGERGVKLSGGEKQRIALARAFLQDNPIVLLDEPTSSLDSLSEQLIQKALAKLMINRTVLIIAHRLTTINQMGRIYVINNGRIVESGTHSQLRELNNGTYQRLWEIQTTHRR